MEFLGALWLICRHWLNGSGHKRKKRVEAAEADKGDNKRKTSVMQTTIRLIKKERKKVMRSRIMREKKRKKGN